MFLQESLDLLLWAEKLKRTLFKSILHVKKIKLNLYLQFGEHISINLYGRKIASV